MLSILANTVNLAASFVALPPDGSKIYRVRSNSAGSCNLALRTRASWTKLSRKSQFAFSTFLAIYFFTPTFARQRGRWSDLSLRERSGSCHKEESTIDNHSAENAKSTRPDHEHRVVSSCRSEIKRVTIDIDNPKTASACQHDMIEPVST